MSSAAPRPPSPELPGKEAWRRDLRNYGIALGACLGGVAAGTLVQKSGWGGQAGALFGFLSGMLAVFCAGALVWAWKVGRRL